MKYFTIILPLFLSTICFGQIDSALVFSGSVDFYYRHNLNATNNPEDGGLIAPASSFANLPGFAIGMANLKTSYTKKKTAVVADLVFGPRGKDALFNSEAPLNILNQLYLTYSINDRFDITAGKFNTYVGYEYISPVLNKNYSTSYLFSYGPFNHTGVRLNAKLGKGFGAMAALLNPTDYTDFNPTDKYFFGSQLSFVKEKFSAYLNGLHGSQYAQYDLSILYTASSTVNFGINGSMAKDLFSGLAFYNTIAFHEKIDLSSRLEYFIDNGLVVLTGENAKVLEATLSLNIKPSENFRIIPEIRLDQYYNDDETKILLSNKNQKSGEYLASFLIAAIAQF